MPHVLNIHTPMKFGKYAGISPFDIWTGAPGHVDPELAAEILNKEVSCQDQKIPLLNALLKVKIDRTLFPWPLSTDVRIGEFRKLIGEYDLNLAFGEKQVTYIHTYRGEPGYIMWLLDETEYCFAPASIDLLSRTKYFVHTHLTIHKFVLSNSHQIFDVLPSNELETEHIPERLVDKNRSKYAS